MTLTPTRRKKLVLIVCGAVIAVVIAAVVAVIVLVLPDQDEEVKSSYPEVTVAEGRLLGQWVDIPGSDVSYASFRGIPYAEPPLGPLRFKPPQPTSWDGIRTANYDGNQCMQEGGGSEDCLYLNVYTPKLNGSDKLLPVYFFIHGGSFIFGSGSRNVYGPEFFLLQNVVVVTINYRLNAFGFLNLDNDIAPGNAGIKDQIAALQWVHRNIEKFGGDPKLITIGGQSAGAASAHWLSLLPESRGLVHRTILESGSALHSWAYNEDNFDVALDLGSRLGRSYLTSVEEVAQLVMEVPAEAILNAALSVVNDRTMRNTTQIPFAVSPERRAPFQGPPALITQDPEKYLLADMNPLPMFLGMNSREWLGGFYYYGWAAKPDVMRARIQDLLSVFPKNVIPYGDSSAYLNRTPTPNEWDQAVWTVRQKFFKDNATDCDDTCVFKKYLDDIFIGNDIARLAELRARNARSETYLYRFAVRAEYSLSPLQDPDQAQGGAVHSDELGYLWKMEELNQTLNGYDLAPTTLRRMVSLWTSYIKNGTPTPEHMTDEYYKEWKQAFLTNEHRRAHGNVIYYDISDRPSLMQQPISSVNAPFWLDVYQQCREGKST
ncbi:Carboxyl/Cholinesterase 23 [Frankliniella occidentalis]|uniref:Carboxylic ester hydrolase n=1 Tax=Frankliniella occidentalis TaxID=133901 RepID=A0A6J1RWD9_FRAOC|nr:juvenile hormone esterase-like [Frankliniella occidentalis]KAE8748920.1 Carboxyl/Cholinesterase 23 [Frankliniella occidentalis]